MKLFFVAALAATVAALHVDQGRGKGAKGKGPKKGGKGGKQGPKKEKPGEKPDGKKKKGGKKPGCKIQKVATYPEDPTSSYKVVLLEFEEGCTAEGADLKWGIIFNDGKKLLDGDKGCKKPKRFYLDDDVWERILTGLESGATPPDDIIQGFAKEAIAGDECGREGPAEPTPVR